MAFARLRAQVLDAGGGTWRDSVAPPRGGASPERGASLQARHTLRGWGLFICAWLASTGARRRRRNMEGQCCATSRWRESREGGFTSSPPHAMRVGPFHLRLACEHRCSTQAQIKSPMHSRASGL